MSARKNTSIRLSDEELKGIDEMAFRHGVKASVIMQKAIRRFIADYEREGPLMIVREEYEEKLASIEAAKRKAAATVGTSASKQQKQA